LNPTDAGARLHADTILVTFYGLNGYDGHAELGEDAARRLRDQLNACLTLKASREMCHRWDHGQPREHRFEGSE
jgi:hypothetical protein